LGWGGKKSPKKVDSFNLDNQPLQPDRFNLKQFNLNQAGTGNQQINTFNLGGEKINLPRVTKPIPSNVRKGTNNFVGRERELELIQTTLQTKQGVIVCAVEGMGGIGKSELALQYANKYQDDYTAMYWLYLRGSSLATEVIS
jgi:hypothetical protein